MINLQNCLRSHETNDVVFRVGFPATDSNGSPIVRPEGIELFVIPPGSNAPERVGDVDFPNDTITWKKGADGNYVFFAAAYFYAAKGRGCGGSCKRYGPPSNTVGVTVNEARPTAPPAPVELSGGCQTTGAPSLSFGG